MSMQTFMTRTLEVLHKAKASLGEGPSWDKGSASLYWVDILGKRVHVYRPDSGSDRSLRMPGPVTCVVPRRSGGCVVTLQHGFYALNLTTSKLSLIAEVESNLAGNRFNDGKCDTAGRFWAGTMNTKEDSATGALYCLSEHHSVRRMVSKVTVSNGLGWTPDDKNMLFADTGAKAVYRFDYDASTGRIRNRRTIADFSEAKLIPDGMAVDSEGMMWIAFWGESAVSRWDPSTGKKLDEIRLPVTQTTSCCFGGKKLDELFITTARVGLKGEALKKEPLAGALFRVKVGVKGLPTNAFAG
jgi:sugar lactone lactonase YvrE